MGLSHYATLCVLLSLWLLNLGQLGQGALLPPTSGGLVYGPCRYPTDATEQTRQRASSPFEVVYIPSEIREYCPDAVVNNIPAACREHWIHRARDLQFNGAVNTPNLHCPPSMYAAVLVDHTDGSASNEVVDGVNCGTLVAQSDGKPQTGVTFADSPESEVLRSIAGRFTSTQVSNRLFWNKFTMYSTAEPSAAATAQLVNVGIRELVYGIRTGELLDFGYPVVALRAVDVLQRQPTYQVTRRSIKQALTTTLIGQVSHDDLAVHFGWPHNDTMPCPRPCQPYSGNSAHGYRCRGYSSTTATTTTASTNSGQQQQRQQQP